MDRINFTINGDHYSLTGQEVSPGTSLNDYLRSYLQLFGTKAMCHEGGCGACVVSVSAIHPVTKEKHEFAVNSCLVNILSCHQWDIMTVEGIGNRKDGYHPVQSRLAAFNGTQCGYCSPGMVMNMYSLSKRSDKFTMRDVENSFGGNICRCTGYRPILEAFKSFANDVDLKIQDKLQDLEDLHEIKCINKCTKKCTKEEEEWCLIENDDRYLKDIALPQGRWYKAYTVQDVFNALSRNGTNSYRLVAGNTGQGIYAIRQQPETWIDISSIPALKEAVSDENLVIGAGTSLTEMMTIFQEWSKKSDFSYLTHFYNHIDLVAHVPVRNLGTIGGNLAMKNEHHDFPSDVFLILETVGAAITLLNTTQARSRMTTQSFLRTNLSGNLILDVRLPPLSSLNLIRTYKIMPRAQNAHAIVNAGFHYKVDSQNKVLSCNLVFGNINPDFVNAEQTMQLMVGQQLFNDVTLQKALSKLKDELVPVDVPPEPSPDCRKTLALGLFYKGVLSLAPSLNARYQSGGQLLQRGVSKGTQNFDTDKSLWPLNKPIPKLEALTQCSGEVKYACDVPMGPRGVHVAFVLSTVHKADIESFDASDALAIPGVVAFYTAKDIPGKNSFTPTTVAWQESDEEILATSVSYYGQPIGLIAAVSRRVANQASWRVRVNYKNVGTTPILTIQEALKAKDKDKRIRQEYSFEPKDRGTDVAHVIRGKYSVPSQYHYTMETQSCSVTNNSRGVVVRSSTQWMDLVNVAVGDALGMDHNRVEVVVPRVGGGYGAKAARSAWAACACAVVAYKLNRSASLVMPLVTNMQVVGKRHQCDFEFEVAVNANGEIQYVNLTSYSDNGYSFNDSAGNLLGALQTLYDTKRWKMVGYAVKTDKACNTWCRAPSTTEATAILEFIMERIAFATKKDPTDIRLMHLDPKHAVVAEMVTSFKTDCNYSERKAEIDNFNRQNAWKKKALKITLMSYPVDFFYNLSVTISVYHVDGTITISHGGIEMGQGINTKVAQVCAYCLKVPLEKITVKASDSFTSPNNIASGGSMASDSVAYATIKACEILLERMQPVRVELNEPTWEELVRATYDKGINLQTSFMKSALSQPKDYLVYGAAAAEVELDVLTGTHVVRRLDLLEDTGISMSPEIDIGQIEGAFMMGVGLWTSENLVYDKTSGRLLTDRTWTYKPPGVKDIPEDFRISFRRNAPNSAGVLRSKATGEPAFVLAVGVSFAIHDAVCEARKEFGYNDVEWVDIDSPNSVENIFKAISPKTEYYKLQ